MSGNFPSRKLLRGVRIQSASDSPHACVIDDKTFKNTEVGYPLVGWRLYQELNSKTPGASFWDCRLPWRSSKIRNFFYRATRHKIPENSNLYSPFSINLSSKAIRKCSLLLSVSIHPWHQQMSDVGKVNSIPRTLNTWHPEIIVECCG